MQKPLPEIRAHAAAAAAALRVTSVSERIEKIARLKQIVLAKRDLIVARLVAETKKTHTDALLSEVFATLDHLEYLEKNAARILADRRVGNPLALLGKKSRIYYEPLGTVLIISPWNYPFYLGLVPLSSAFAAGNSVIYKPSEVTPLQGLFEKCLEEAGFEPDWVQVVYGDGAVGASLIASRPDRIVFTGSFETGKKILTAAAPLLIPVTLELGGKDPMVVFSDANVERASAGALWGGLTNSGQSCTSVELLYVEDGIYDRFRARLLERAAEIVSGRDLGRITAPFQVEKIKEQLAEAKRGGARILSGAEWDGKSDAIPPILVEGAPEGCALLCEETFGPVIALRKFRDESEVVLAINQSPFGLSASVWTADLVRATRVARALHTGNVSVNNVMLTEANPALPFGGTKYSGFGRLKGEAGLRELCHEKSVLIDKSSDKIEAHWFPYADEKQPLFEALVTALFTPGPMRLVRFALAGLKLEGLAKTLERRARR